MTQGGGGVETPRPTLISEHSSFDHDNECQSLIRARLFNSSLWYRVDKLSMCKLFSQQSIPCGLVTLLGECSI